MNGSAERLGQTIYRKAAPLLKHAGLDLKFWPEAIKHAAYLYMRSPHSKIKKTPFEAWNGRRPHISHIRTFGSTVYYSNPERLRKLIRNEASKGILVGYEGDTLYRILKPDGRICRAAALQTVERMLWQQFDPEDIQEDSDTDYFTDSTRPGVHRTFEHIRPTPISIALSHPVRGEKRPADKDWFVQPVTKTRVPSYGSQPRSRAPVPQLPVLISSGPPLSSLRPPSNGSQPHLRALAPYPPVQTSTGPPLSNSTRRLSLGIPPAPYLSVPISSGFPLGPSRLPGPYQSIYRNL
jgi:hypothetical protein